jgi:hypothetical protein
VRLGPAGDRHGPRPHSAPLTPFRPPNPSSWATAASRPPGGWRP